MVGRALEPSGDESEPQGDFLRRALESKDVVLFCGHGSGEELLARERITALSGRRVAAALLMGCGSARLRPQGEFEPAGVVLSYVLAGSPAVVGNLWDVTDKDIDRFTVELLERWALGAAGQRVDLARAVQASRDVCRLSYLVGAAPVCLGLPLPALPSTSPT
jgi:separase